VSLTILACIQVVEVNAAGYPPSQSISPVPSDPEVTGQVGLLVDQCPNLLTQHVEDRQVHRTFFRQRIGNYRLRVERIGVVPAQTIFCRGHQQWGSQQAVLTLQHRGKFGRTFG
jgi:hypothetical protein